MLQSSVNEGPRVVETALLLRNLELPSLVAVGLLSSSRLRVFSFERLLSVRTHSNDGYWQRRVKSCITSAY